MSFIRVYVIDMNKTDFDFREAELRGDYASILRKSESLCDVYNLASFQSAINNEELNIENSYILFASVNNCGKVFALTDDGDYIEVDFDKQ